MLVLDPVEDFINFLYYVEHWEILLLLLGLEPMQLAVKLECFSQHKMKFHFHRIGWGMYIWKTAYVFAAVSREVNGFKRCNNETLL